MMETFAEAWVAANTQTALTEAAADGHHVQGPQDSQLGMCLPHYYSRELFQTLYCYDLGAVTCSQRRIGLCKQAETPFL